MTTQQLKDSWPEILEAVQRLSRGSWLVVYTATPRSLDGDVLTLAFRSQGDVAGFRPAPGATESVSEHLRTAIAEVLGLRVKFLPRVDETGARGEERSAVPEGARDVAAEPVAEPAPAPSASERDPAAGTADGAGAGAGAGEAERAQIDADGWAVVSIPGYDDADAAPAARVPIPEGLMKPASSLATPAPKPASAPAPVPASTRYGEAVVRELLKAEFIEEQSIAPRAVPVAFDVATADVPPEDVPPVPEEDR